MRAAFLDRDDTLIVNVPYLGDPSRVTLCPGAREAVALWLEAGWKLILVSNQSGVGRGLITKDQVAAVNREMYLQLGVNGFDGEYCCYAAPGDPYGAEERKPSPALVLQACADLGIDPARGVMVGDKYVDVECGRRAGCRTVLVLTGSPGAQRDLAARTADHVASGILEAAQWSIGTPDVAEGSKI